MARRTRNTGEFLAYFFDSVESEDAKREYFARFGQRNAEYDEYRPARRDKAMKTLEAQVRSYEAQQEHIAELRTKAKTKLGANVAYAHDHGGLTYQQIADVLGVHHSHVMRLAQAARETGFAELVELSQDISDGYPEKSRSEQKP